MEVQSEDVPCILWWGFGDPVYGVALVSVLVLAKIRALVFQGY